MLIYPPPRWQIHLRARLAEGFIDIFPQRVEAVKASGHQIIKLEIVFNGFVHIS